jgi:hypothetical protein
MAPACGLETRPARGVWACTLGVCFVWVSACASGPVGGQTLDRLAPAPYGDLATLVRDLFIPGADSQGYVTPAVGDLSAFAAAIKLIAARAFDEATKRTSALGYDLQRVADPAAPNLAVLVEHPSKLRGGGTFVFDMASTSSLVIEVPHPLADAGTLDEGVQLFVQAHAAALFIGGTHRCADTASTPCIGAEATNACAGRLRISDAAHFAASLFQVAHETVFALSPDSRAVSLHAHVVSVGEPDLTVSGGTRQRLSTDAPANRLRDGLRVAGFTASSCNSAADPIPRLCGDANVQGRFSNGVADACLQDATQTRGRFLHVEQSAVVLVNPATIVATLAANL